MNFSEIYTSSPVPSIATKPNPRLVVLKRPTIRFDSAASPSLVIYPFDGVAIVPALPAPQVGISSETQGNIGSLGGYYNEIKYYLDCLEAGQKPGIVTPEGARESVRFSLAAAESARTGKIIDLG